VFSLSTSGFSYPIRWRARFVLNTEYMMLSGSPVSITQSLRAIWCSLALILE